MRLVHEEGNTEAQMESLPETRSKEGVNSHEWITFTGKGNREGAYNKGSRGGDVCDIAPILKGIKKEEVEDMYSYRSIDF